MTGDAATDAFLGGKMILKQFKRGHRIGTDAILLAAAGRAATSIADLGCGSGGAGIAAALRLPDAALVLADKDRDALCLADENLAGNGLAGRGRCVEADFFAPEKQRAAAGLAREAFDLVLTNPPFFEMGAGRASPDAKRHAAHRLEGGTLDDWIATAASVTRPGGALAIVHRADALGALLEAMAGRFGGILLRFVHPRENENAIRVLALAIKGSRAPLSVARSLELHNADGSFTAEAEAINRGEARSI